MHIADLPAPIVKLIRDGIAIPAHPLALTRSRELDPRRQCALSRYYIDAGARGLAVGVHTTQFAIRDFGMLQPVLELARDTAESWAKRPIVMVAGLVGSTRQATSEADLAVGLGYHAGLLSLAAHRGASEDSLIEHCRAVAARIPLFGFYLQEAVGGIPLSAMFWRRFAEIDNVVGVKIAPFNRYRTLDVVRGIVAAKAEDRVTLYTGNDDHIVLDLITPFTVRRGDDEMTIRIKGGLLGHWSVWTKRAVELLDRCHAAAAQKGIEAELLALDAKVTDCNAAVFDVANAFAGVIAGCHEVLRRQGLLVGTWCLDPHEKLGPGQADEITRVMREHPELTDDEFVAENLERWLS
ncbi:MAG: dihydrodipicolinate synthase family protein [Hyphomicrobiales bacterium]|nr:dihydrodipicolinate synthase family protein [Hyphomicrobiales bacterium]